VLLGYSLAMRTASTTIARARTPSRAGLALALAVVLGIIGAGDCIGAPTPTPTALRPAPVVAILLSPFLTYADLSPSTTPALWSLAENGAVGWTLGRSGDKRPGPRRVAAAPAGGQRRLARTATARRTRRSSQFGWRPHCGSWRKRSRRGSSRRTAEAGGSRSNRYSGTRRRHLHGRGSALGRSASALRRTSQPRSARLGHRFGACRDRVVPQSRRAAGGRSGRPVTRARRRIAGEC
jgi:hypothetical protein